MADEADWVICKRGYFYRPDRRGYTSSLSEAGRYTREDAEAEAAIEESITARPASDFECRFLSGWFAQQFSAGIRPDGFGGKE